jgi:hypothetical protein
MKTEAKVHLNIFDFTCSHEDVAKAFALDPSKIWNAANLIGDTNKSVPLFPGWGCDSELPKTVIMSGHIQKILDKILPQ